VSSKYTQIVEDQPDGWSDWVQPTEDTNGKPFAISCCHCGLVHDVEFQSVLDRTDEDAGKVYVVVQFRVKRNLRATAQKRRHGDFIAKVERP
jgi:hypothetical protein